MPFPNNQINHQQHQHPYMHPGNQRNQNQDARSSITSGSRATKLQRDGRYYQNEQQTGQHQPFFKNNQFPHRYHDRNNQRHYQNQHNSHSINGNASGDHEPAGKLAIKPHEKQWLINIQLLQLNTIQPYIDDHYYIVFCDKRNKRDTNPDKKHYNNGYHRDHKYVFFINEIYIYLLYIFNFILNI